MLCNIEATTLCKLAKKDILYASAACAGELSEIAAAKKAFLPEADCKFEEETIIRLSGLTSALHERITELTDAISEAETKESILEKACFFKDTVLTKMEELREIADELEATVSRKHWPFPTYGDLLFSVR